MSWIKSLFGKAEPQKVLVNASGLQLMVVLGETILEQALKVGSPCPHDCTVGTCRTRGTNLISDKVDAITPLGYALSRKELQAGYILACQAVAKTDLVVEVELQTQSEERVTATAKLAETTPLTHDNVRVVWETHLPMHYRAGQYLNMCRNGGQVHRSYSLTTAPEKFGQTRLVTFIRPAPGGAFRCLRTSGTRRPGLSLRSAGDDRCRDGRAGAVGRAARLNFLRQNQRCQYDTKII
jgi:p-cymene monooxygenase electron transfer component